MLRRDIFNLIFNKSPDTGSVLADPIVATPDYVSSSEDAVCSKTWHIPFLPQSWLPEWSVRHSFTLTLETKSTTGIFMLGKVRVGIENGCLFIGQLVGQTVALDSGKGQGIQLIVTVNPQPNFTTYTKLSLLDGYGLTLAILKSTQQLTSDWEGLISLETSFSALSAQGVLTSKPVPNYQTTV